MTHQGCRWCGRVADGGFRLSDGLVQLADEVFKVLQATFADLPEVFSEGDLQLLLQVGVFGHQHLYHHTKSLTVLTIHLGVTEKSNVALSEKAGHNVLIQRRLVLD